MKLGCTHLTQYAFLLFCLVAAGCVESSAAGDEPTKRNVLLICVDDLRPELNCFGVEHIQSPNIDALARRGRAFHRHYVQAPTCGASRYALLTGRYGVANNEALFQRAALMEAAGVETPANIPADMPTWFKAHGYTTVSVGKVSHHPGGRGGKDWNDDAQPEMPGAWDRHLLAAGPWKTPRGWMHGLANGETRGEKENSDGVRAMAVFESVQGPDSIYPDGVSIEEGLSQLDLVAADKKPFFLAVGILRPHLPFGAPAKYLAPYVDLALPPIPHPQQPVGRTTWTNSGEFMKYNRWGHDPNTNAEFATEVRRHYAACVSYADAQVGRLLDRLKESGAADDTIVVLWGDHGWHLGEHAVWGKHTLFEESLRSPLIVHYPGIVNPGQPSSAMISTIDIFPTLCAIAGIQSPNFVDGVSLKPVLEDPTAAGHNVIAYTGKARTIRTQTHRLVLHNDGFVELYDHTTSAGETENIADENPKLVSDMKTRLLTRMDR